MIEARRATDLAAGLLRGAAAFLDERDGHQLLLRALEVASAAVGAQRGVLRLPDRGGEPSNQGRTAVPHLEGRRLRVPIGIGQTADAVLEFDLASGHPFVAHGALPAADAASLAAFASLVAELSRSACPPLDRHAMALNQVAIAFARSQTVEEVILAALHALNETFRPLSCGAFIQTEDPTTGYRIEDDTLIRRLRPWTLSTLPDPLRAIYTVGHARFYESAAQVVAEHGIDRCVDPRFVCAAVHLPLFIDGVVVGGLGVEFGRHRHYRDDERELLLTLARLCAEAVRRARGFEEERRRARRSEALREVSEALSSAATVQEVAEVAVRGLSRALGSSACALSLLREAAVVPLATVGAPAALDEAAVEAVRRTASPIWFDEDQPPPGSPAGAEPLWRAFVPVVMADEVAGVVAVGLPDGQPWRTADRGLVETVVSLAAEALRRAMLLEVATGSAERYQELFDSYEHLFRGHPSALLVVDQAGELVVAANDAAAAVFGRDAASLLETPFERLLHPSERHDAVFRGDAAAGGPRGFRVHPLLLMQRASGPSFVAEVTSTTVEFAGRPARLASISDQTARVHAERDRALLQERVVTVSEEERRRLSLELHDGPVQDLAVSVMRMGALSRSLRGADDDAVRRLTALEEHTRTIVEVLRNLMQRLSPPNLEERSLGELTAEVIASGPWAGSLTIDLDDTLAMPVPSPLKAALYRVLVEALTNVYKHASAQRVRITLSADNTDVELEVADDGVGLSEADRGRSGHFGLSSMRDRVVLLGGRFSIETSPSGGTAVRAAVSHRVTQPVERILPSALR